MPLLGEDTGKEFVISQTPTDSAKTASEDRVGFATVLVGPGDEDGKQRFLLDIAITLLSIGHGMIVM